MLNAERPPCQTPRGLAGRSRCEDCTSLGEALAVEEDLLDCASLATVSDKDLLADFDQSTDSQILRLLADLAETFAVRLKENSDNVAGREVAVRCPGEVPVGIPRLNVYHVSWPSTGQVKLLHAVTAGKHGLHWASPM